LSGEAGSAIGNSSAGGMLITEGAFSEVLTAIYINSIGILFGLLYIDWYI
jgi:hypothetical protein